MLSSITHSAAIAQLLAHHTLLLLRLCPKPNHLSRPHQPTLLLSPTPTPQARLAALLGAMPAQSLLHAMMLLIHTHTHTASSIEHITITTIVIIITIITFIAAIIVIIIVIISIVSIPAITAIIASPSDTLRRLQVAPLHLPLPPYLLCIGLSELPRIAPVAAAFRHVTRGYCAIQASTVARQLHSLLTSPALQAPTPLPSYPKPSPPGKMIQAMKMLPILVIAAIGAGIATLFFAPVSAVAFWCQSHRTNWTVQQKQEETYPAEGT